jgi:hypothetical protein
LLLLLIDEGKKDGYRAFCERSGVFCEWSGGVFAGVVSSFASRVEFFAGVSELFLFFQQNATELALF